MDGNLLAEVLAVEKEVQLRLEQEKGNAEAWLDGVRREADAEMARATQQFEEEARRHVEETVEVARQEAVRLVDEAREYCERLDDLDVGALRSLARRRVERILPEDG